MNFLLVMGERHGDSSIRSRLEDAGHTLDWTADNRHAAECVSSSRYDAVIVDLGVSDETRIGLCAELRTLSEGLPILALSTSDRTADRLESFSAGVDDVLAKPFDFDELMARLTAIQPRKVPARADAGARPTHLIILERRIDAMPRPRRSVELTDRERRVFDVLLGHRAEGVPVALALCKACSLDFDALDKWTGALGVKLALRESLAFMRDVQRKLFAYGTRLGRSRA